MRRVIFVGSNPSNASPDLSAFHESTKSSRILRDWIKEANVSEAVSVNVSDETTLNNRALTKSEIESLSYDLENKIRNHMTKDTKVVALGKTAAKALSFTGLKFFELPHPSGLNRLLNNQDFVKRKIQELKDFIDT